MGKQLTQNFLINNQHQREKMRFCFIAVALMAIMVVSEIYTNAAPMESEDLAENQGPLEFESRGQAFDACWNDGDCHGWGCTCRISPGWRRGSCGGGGCSRQSGPGGR